MLHCLWRVVRELGGMPIRHLVRGDRGLPLRAVRENGGFFGWNEGPLNLWVDDPGRRPLYFFMSMVVHVQRSSV